MAEISESDLRAAHTLFGARFDLAERYVEHLATSGIERGLLGPREVPRLWSRHVLNCAVIAELFPSEAMVADVGSGAGLPGIALAIARPDLSLTLIEPLERRVIWLREVITDLELPNVEVFRGRAEEAVGKVEATVVTARAVSALGGLAAMTIPILQGKGELLAIKGQSAPEEVAKSRKLIRKLGGRDVTVQQVGGELLEQPTTVVRVLVG
ncbi:MULTISPECIES: 16S rRNA (guanine(527)-N(7))-methyltransferase RsmG [unclassified Arthrobacter]|uniref:16S rRNA (guanine(527)-N(7))-methyltransferase RsmG n=1 Tax=unclassified Arthrobacter TaxID=235627 RepID=UPI001490F3D4|nr:MULTISPECIES: 16S rRNA (guanine(527)-N(7))-methyltransferase RsmG [unclassified Arthrobacter]MBE0008499.1 16S rRNA (guanine(527)-N(7))-methyltransferase RsmG [Arthrobacter sp. AET 35A]NOJ62239.1 16S rRNA (guanine(527)-N(7))-methyltransferase RsmG [Arthrobacter sp. 147(2020)]